MSILCTFSEIYLVPTSKNESVQSPPSSLIQPIFRISKFVDDTIPSEKCKTLCQILNMMTTSSEKDYSIDILIGSILPKILQRIIEGYSQQDRGKYIYLFLQNRILIFIIRIYSRESSFFLKSSFTYLQSKTSIV